MERRAGAKGNAGQERTLRTQGRDGAPQGLDRVRQAARQGKETRFTALWRHVDVDRLREAFHALKRDAAPGVDGLTSRDYETDLDSKLADPCDRVHKGGPYHPLPSRRRFIPKADGKQRPLAVAALEDKIVQAVGRGPDGQRKGDGAGIGDLAAARQRLPPLRHRPLSPRNGVSAEPWET